VTFFSAIPVPETEVGIALETVRGTPVAPAYWIPVMGPKYKPDVKLLPDEGMRGSMVKIYDELPSLRVDTHAWDQYPYLDSFPVLVRACLGSKDTKTTAPANSKLVKEAKVGDVAILIEATIAEGSYITFGVGAGVVETHLTGAVTEVKASEFKVTLTYPVVFAHPISTVVTGLTKHEFSLLNNARELGNQPPSYTITDQAGEEEASIGFRQLAASQLDSLTITGAADALPKVAVNWFSNLAIKPTPPVPSFTSVPTPPGWAVQAAMGGTQVGYLVNWEFAFKRGVKNIPAVTGTMNYYQHFAYALEATAKFTFLEDPKATWLTAYQNGEQLAQDLTLGDAESGFAVNFHSTKSKFITGDLDRSKEWVEVHVESQLIPSATDALAGGVSPVKITVANATATEY
jgi:hypothetical protein